MRALIGIVLVLAVGAVAGDLVAERLVTGRAETRLAARGVTDPQVTVGGLAFLPQLLARDFGEVRLRAASVRLGGSTAQRLRVTGRDVRAPQGSDVTVGTVWARGVVTYAEVLAQAGVRGVTLRAADGGLVRLRGEVAGGELPGALDAALTEQLTLTYRWRELPAGLVIDQVTPGSAGFLVTVTGTDVVLAAADGLT